MSDPFPGFPRQMPVFFRGLEKNNDRDWFLPRKQTFETNIRQPMIDLVTLLNKRLLEFAPDHVAAQPAKLIYRIYRDTRFSKDKTPYKTHIAATFAHGTLPRHGGAGYYFEVSHRCVGIAGGIYMPGPEELQAVRSAITTDAKGFLAVVQDRHLRKLFGELQGARLKRVPTPWQMHAESPAAEYLKFKQFYWYVECPASVALTSRLPSVLLRYFKAVAPGVDWFNRVVLAARNQQGDEPRPLRPEPMW